MSACTSNRSIEIENTRPGRNYAAVFCRAPHGMAIIDGEGRILEANRALAELFDHPLPALLGQPEARWVHEQDRDRNARYLERLFSDTDSAVSFDQRYLRADGVELRARVHAVRLPERFDDQPVALLDVRDITAARRLHESMAESEARLQAVIASMAEGLVVHDLDGRIIMHNEAACSILGLSCDELVGRDSLNPDWRTIRPDGSDFPGDEHPAMRTLATGQACSEVIMGVQRPDGELRWIEIHSEPVRRELSAEIFAVVVSFSDVTERLAADRRIRDSEERLALALAGADLGMWTLDLTSQSLQFSHGASRVLGYAPDEVPETRRAVLALMHPDDQASALADMMAHLDGQRAGFESVFRVLGKNGEYIWLLARGRVIRRDAGGQALRVSGTVMDVTQWKELEIKLVHLATTDELTGLLNRRAGVDTLQSNINAAHRYGRALSMVLLDLDHFKRINDELGHHVGDQVLSGVGQAIRGAIRASDHSVRWGGEEFAVILPETGASEAIQQAQRLFAVIGEVAAWIPGVERLTASMGVVSLQPGEKAGDFMRRADALMYKVKTAGRAGIRADAPAADA